MGFFRTLGAKPWQPAQGMIDNLHDGRSFALAPGKLGLRFFLGVVSILFFMLVVAYGERMATEEWRPTPQRALLWANTALLVLASVGLQWARIAARRGRTDLTEAGLIAGGVFTIAFLGGQVLAWRQLHGLPAFDITDAAVAFFYLITALHGLHLLGGLTAWAATVLRLWRGDRAERLRPAIELCAVYWHYLLALWLVLFGLLFSGNDNLGLLLALCGLR